MGIINQSEFKKENVQIVKSGRNVKLMYNKEPLQFCTSTMYSPFGTRGISKEWSNYTEFNVDCSINQSNSEASKTFREFISELDESIKESVSGNLSLFNTKSVTADSEYAYCSILRENGSYPKLMKLNFPRDKNGNFESFIFDEQKNKIRLLEDNIESIVKKGRLFKCIVECVKVWYYNGKVGTLWKIVQLKFAEKEIIQEPEEQETKNSRNIYMQNLIDDD